MATHVSTSAFGAPALRLPHAVRRWFPLVLVLMLALMVRLPLLSDAGYPGDLLHSAYWLRVIDQHGVFHFYEPELRFGVWDRAYPPLATLTFEAMRVFYGGSVQDARAVFSDWHFIFLHKLLPLMADLVLIAAVGWWSRRQSRGWLLIAGALALAPGLLITSAWWGQYESLFAVFLVLALISLNQDRPLLAWLMFALAVLIKQPALIVGPLLLVVTLRRYGWQRAGLGLVAAGALCAVFTTPFALASGLENALSPYLKASDAFPYLTNNAYNGWYILASVQRGGSVIFQDAQLSDALPMLGVLSYKLVGLLLLGAFVLLLMVVAWNQAHLRREFVWGAALSLGLFILPTQVHERYLYLPVVLTLIACVQDRRLWPLAFGLIVTYSYNVLMVILPARWPLKAQLAPFVALAPLIALANIGLFAALVRWALSPPPTHAETDVVPQLPARIGTTVPHQKDAPRREWSRQA